MKKTVYYTATGIFCLWMIKNAIAYLSAPQAKILCTHFGFPDYFRIELAIAKIMGVLVLLFPLKGRLKEWAYAGFTIVMISGFIAHVCSGDSMGEAFPAMLALGLLMASYFYKPNELAGRIP